MTDKNRQKGNESVGEKSDDLALWQIMVAGPAGYVRREAFAGSSLAEALENVRKQGFAWVEDEDSGFPDVLVTTVATETVGTTKGMKLSEAEIEVMRDVVDDLDCELQAKYSGYPIDNHRRIRDFGVVERARAILARPAPEALGAAKGVTDEIAMRVALAIIANLEDRRGVLDDVDDEIKQEIAEEIAMTIKAKTFPSAKDQS